MAEGVGFEPTEARRPQRLSRPSHSSTLASFRRARLSGIGAPRLQELDPISRSAAGRPRPVSGASRSAPAWGDGLATPLKTRYESTDIAGEGSGSGPV